MATRTEIAVAALRNPDRDLTGADAPSRNAATKSRGVFVRADMTLVLRTA